MNCQTKAQYDPPVPHRPVFSLHLWTFLFTLLPYTHTAISRYPYTQKSLSLNNYHLLISTMAMMAWINSNSPGVHLGVKSATATLTSDCTSPSSSLKVSDSLKSSTSPSTAPTGSVGSGSQQSSNGRKLAEVVDEVSNSISTADIRSYSHWSQDGSYFDTRLDARSTYRSSHQDRISEYSVDSVGYMPNPPVFIASVVTAEGRNHSQLSLPNLITPKVSGATPQGSSHGRAPTYSIELEMALRQEATLESQNVPGLSEKPVSRMKKARKLMKKSTYFLAINKSMAIHILRSFHVHRGALRRHGSWPQNHVGCVGTDYCVPATSRCSQPLASSKSTTTSASRVRSALSASRYHSSGPRPGYG